MIINDAMIVVLSSIRLNERGQRHVSLNAANKNIGNRLIKLYYQTPNIHTRELITEFMTQAGVVWLRKLLTKDTASIASTESRFASLDDYLSLLVANDSSVGLRAQCV